MAAHIHNEEKEIMEGAKSGPKAGHLLKNDRSSKKKKQIPLRKESA